MADAYRPLFREVDVDGIRASEPVIAPSLAAGPSRVIRPFCLVCEKVVDGYKTWRNEEKRETVFVLYCHSAKETVRISDVDAETGESAPRVAFAPL